MAKRRKLPRVSPGEMEILAMFWQEGPLGLSEAHQRFDRYGRPVGYPTMQTRLNRLVAKGLLRRTSDRPAVYRVAVTPEEVTAGQLTHWLNTIGRRSVAPLVSQLISERPLSREEVADLRRLLAEAERCQDSQDERRGQR